MRGLAAFYSATAAVLRGMAAGYMIAGILAIGLGGGQAPKDGAMPFFLGSIAASELSELLRKAALRLDG